MMIMKSIMMPIETICHFDKDGRITPYRFRYYKDGETVVTVDGIISRDVNTFAGNPIYIYQCITRREDKEVQFELKYEDAETSGICQKSNR